MASSERPTEQERQMFCIDPRRRREDSYIRKIRDSNPQIFEEICRRFVRGDSVTGVATWLWHLRPKGFLSTASFPTIQNYIMPLRSRVREQIRDRAEQIHSLPPTPVAPPARQTERVIQTVNEVVEQVQSISARPHVTDELRIMVDKRVAEVRGLEMLKYLFFQQDRRLRRHLEFEADGNGMLTTEGSVAIDVMRKIAEGVCKVELGENLLSTKRLHQGINPPGVDGSASPSPQGDAIIRRFENLSPVDKNLARDAGTKFIDMIREEIGGGFKAGELGSSDTPNQ